MRALTLLLIAVVAAGCADAVSNAGLARAATNKIERFLITKPDLPMGYALEQRKRFSASSCPSRIATRQVSTRKLAALGLRGCALAVFSKEVASGGGASTLNNPESVAFLMRDERAASAALRALRTALLVVPPDSGVEAHSLRAPRLGDQAPRGIVLTLGDFSIFNYLWRRGNVIAWVESSDVLGDFDAGKTLKLARRLDARGRD